MVCNIAETTLSSKAYTSFKLTQMNLKLGNLTKKRHAFLKKQFESDKGVFKKALGTFMMLVEVGPAISN
jgi:predicted RNA-binding protein (virulence factor B family)